VAEQELPTIVDRLAYWREKVARISLRDLRDAINKHLPPDRQVSHGTVRNYASSGPDSHTRPSPRVDVVVALKRAFPSVNLAWLFFGHGEPEKPESSGGPVEPATSEAAERGWVLTTAISDRLDYLSLPEVVTAVLADLAYRWLILRYGNEGGVVANFEDDTVDQFLKSEVGAALSTDFSSQDKRVAAILAQAAALYLRLSE